MNIEHELQIERYLGGLMTPEEIAEFEQQVISDENLKRELLLTEDINVFLKKRLQEVSTLDIADVEIGDSISLKDKKEIKRRLKKVENLYFERTTESKKNGGNFIYFLMSSAAIVLVIIGIYFSSLDRTNGELYASYYDSNDLPSFILRSDANTLLQTATQNYKEGKLDVALNQFESYIERGQDVDALSYIYTAIIYADTNRLEEAITQLDILQNSDSLDADKALWFKTMIYLKFDQREKAAKSLDKLLLSGSNYKKAEAKELLEQL